MKHLLSLLLIATILTGFIGCNTVGGAGKDLSAAGHDVTKTANKVQQKISNGY